MSGLDTSLDNLQVKLPTLTFNFVDNVAWTTLEVIMLYALLCCNGSSHLLIVCDIGNDIDG